LSYPRALYEENLMTLLVWIGAAISAAGLAGLVWCIFAVARARRTGLADEEMRTLLRRAVTVNMAAFLVSILGLMMVVVGVMLS
jgi:hypothetical protein